MLAAAGLLMLLPTACTDDLDGNGGTQGEGYGVPLKGISFYEAEAFVEDTLTSHQPTIETNVDEGPDMDVMGQVTYNSQTEAKARRAAAANGGMPRHSLKELTDGPNLAKELKRHQRAHRAAAQAGKVVAGRKPAAPMRHKATAKDSVQTRSLDVDDVTSIFVVGDSVGVYEFDGSGNLVNDNVKLVLNISGEWNSDTEVKYTEGHRYFAYHPYRTNAQLTTLGATVGATTNYETFFSDFANKWPVTNDQGVYEKYHACDLLAGEAVWDSGTETLGFPMHHLMGMLQLEFGTARIYLDWADEREEHYPYWWTDTVTTSLKDGMILLPKFSGKYRRITRPGSELWVVAADSAWTLHFEAEKSISRGHYQHYDIGRTASNSTEDFYQIFYNQLGDILLQDGRLIHRHDWRRIGGSNPVGIVVGTVYPSIDPFSGAVVGPVEDENYNCHSLEREYLYTMDEDSRETHPGQGGNPDTTLVKLKPRFIRCLVMSLKDVWFNQGTQNVAVPASDGAAWSWNEALSHFPNTHCVGVPANNVWSHEDNVSRVNNYWYPDMPSNWKAKAACESFNNATPGQGGSGVSEGFYGTRQFTPNSGWFIGTAGQYQMAFCFGRERAHGDSWKRVLPRNGHPEDLDDDGAHIVWDPVLTIDGEIIEWYNPQYPSTQQIGKGLPANGPSGTAGAGPAQNATTYIDFDYYRQERGSGDNKRIYENYSYWYFHYNEEVPTVYHDFARINNAMDYAVGQSSGGYDLLSGEYITSTAYCDLDETQRFFPNLAANWNFQKHYWNYKDWYYLVTVNIDLNTPTRGQCYYLNNKHIVYSGKIRPLMAL